MNPVYEELVALGLMEVCEGARDMIEDARHKIGHNDVVIVAFCEDHGKDDIEARMYGLDRKTAHARLSNTIPEAKTTLDRMGTNDLPPTRFLTIISYKGSLYSIDLPVPHSTTGVFN